jgi:hypothetical protein
MESSSATRKTGTHQETIPSCQVACLADRGRFAPQQHARREHARTPAVLAEPQPSRFPGATHVGRRAATPECNETREQRQQTQDTNGEVYPC